MKRVISLIFLLGCLLLILEWGFTFFKDGHQLKYEVISNNKKIGIIEKYQKDKDDSYYLELNSDNYTFIYNASNKFNKQKEIVDKIEIYEKDGMLCVYPVLINNVTLDIQCNINNQIYSYEAIKNNSSVNEFVLKLKESGYKSLSWEAESNNETKFSTFKVYYDNLLNEDIITVWNYKGIDIISKKASSTKIIYSYDKYENNHGSIVGKYYVVPVYDSNKVFDFSKLNIIELESKDLKTFDLDITLNQDSYINGVVGNKLYYFDPDNLLQYEVDVNKKKIRIIGDRNINAQFYNGDWETINIYDFVGKVKKFELKVDEKVMSYNPTSVYQSSSNYYYITSDGSFYKLNKNNLDKPILLWKKSGLKEIKVINDTIYFIIGDTLYYYQDNTGIRKIITNNEWNYNYTNIYDLYKKPINE